MWAKFEDSLGDPDLISDPIGKFYIQGLFLKVVDTQFLEYSP